MSFQWYSVPAAESGLEHREFVLGAAAIAGGDGTGLRDPRDGGRQTRPAGRASTRPKVVEDIEFQDVEFEYRDGPSGRARFQRAGRRAARSWRLSDAAARARRPSPTWSRGFTIRRADGFWSTASTSATFVSSRYRDLLAIVQQDVFLFDGSVRDNIAYGRHDATNEEVLDAAKRANAHEFIERLPEQYDTFVGERGVKLSGGQQQRLAIARAILKSPQILILDEATSNLDTESEQLIQAAMASLFAGRTTFVIAHRLSTVRRANLILLMEDGRIIERGTHESLMAAQGLYYDMVLRQAQSQDNEQLANNLQLR